MWGTHRLRGREPRGNISGLGFWKQPKAGKGLDGSKTGEWSMEDGEHEMEKWSHGQISRVALLNKGNVGMSECHVGNGLPRQTLICPLQAPTVMMKEDGSFRERRTHFPA